MPLCLTGQVSSLRIHELYGAVLQSPTSSKLPASPMLACQHGLDPMTGILRSTMLLFCEHLSWTSAKLRSADPVEDLVWRCSASSSTMPSAAVDSHSSRANISVLHFSRALREAWGCSSRRRPGWSSRGHGRQRGRHWEGEAASQTLLDMLSGLWNRPCCCLRGKLR